MDPALHDHFAEIERDHWWFQGRRSVVSSVLRHEFPRGRSGSEEMHIFDAGCGTGEMVDMLREFGSVSAIDASTDAVRHCRQRFGGTVEVELGQIPDDLPPPGAVQLITAFDVLEHLDDDLSALRRIHAALPPEGALVVTVPAYRFLWGQHDVLSGHRRRYRAAQLHKVIEEAGFRVDRLSYFNTLLFPLVAAVRGCQRLRSRGTFEAGSDFTMPSPILNQLLLTVFSSESRILRRCSLPFGVSILAVARKPR